jgi:putative ABC transport system permease protein
LEDETPVEELKSALTSGQVVMTHGFALSFQVEVGDEIDLETPSGVRRVRVGGVVRGFTGPTGGLMIDLDTFDRYFHRNGASVLAIWSTGPLLSVWDEIVRRSAISQPLFFESGQEFRNAARRIADRFDGLLYLLLAIAGFLCAIGLTAVVASSITARAADLALMQIGGATPAGIVTLVLMDSALLVLFAALAGALLGVVSAGVVADMFRETLGWTIDTHIPVRELVFASSALVLTTTAAAAGPAWAAARRELPAKLPLQ